MTSVFISSDRVEEKDDEDIYAVGLGLSELGLGSLLHALHIPLAGTFLSLNQIFLLTCSLLQSSHSVKTWAPFLISTRASLVKSLSPVGKKLTPMLAICMQGLLYNIGVLCFGNTVLGRCTGGILSSLWGFCQPLLLYRMFFGPSFFEALGNFSWAAPLFLGLILMKIAATASIVLFTPYLPAYRIRQYLHRVAEIAARQTARQKPHRPLRQALGDLCSPFFLFSLLLTAAYFYFSEGVSEALICGILRPLALAYAFYVLLRIVPLKRWAKHGN